MRDRWRPLVQPPDGLQGKPAARSRRCRLRVPGGSWKCVANVIGRDDVKLVSGPQVSARECAEELGRVRAALALSQRNEGESARQLAACAAAEKQRRAAHTELKQQLHHKSVYYITVAEELGRVCEFAS